MYLLHRKLSSILVLAHKVFSVVQKP